MSSYIPHIIPDSNIERTALAIIVAVGLVGLGISLLKQDKMIL